MSESGVGLSVAAIRQKAGKSLKDGPGGATLPAGAGLALGGAGMMNAPAFTVCAEVMVVFGNESDERLSQVAAAAGAGVNDARAASPSAADRIRAARQMPADDVFGRGCGFM